MPTASDVVADVVDASKNLNRKIMTMWEPEKLPLQDKGDTKRRFFVRMSGNMSELRSEIEQSFGEVGFVEVPELGEEFGFITPIMMEGDYDTRAKGFPNILHMIRIEE